MNLELSYEYDNPQEKWNVGGRFPRFYCWRTVRQNKKGTTSLPACLAVEMFTASLYSLFKILLVRYCYLSDTSGFIKEFSQFWLTVDEKMGLGVSPKSYRLNHPAIMLSYIISPGIGYCFDKFV